MKTSVFTLVTAFMLLLSATACSQKNVSGNKRYTTKEVRVKDFTKIRLNGSPDVIYTQSHGRPSVEIYAASNIIDYVEAFVERGTLIVQIKRNSNLHNIGKVEVRVSSPELNGVHVHGSGDIILREGIRTNRKFSAKINGSGDISGRKIECYELEADINGSGDIALNNIKAITVEARVNGSGDIVLNGKTEDASYHVNGSGDIRATGLKADHVKANVSGSGDIRCHATRTLEGGARGSGTVAYKGNPDINFSKKGLRRL